ncbi:MAG: hypothetical protein JWR19_863 [Pedosphaera sp.]|nr:hypothetical protein [Pedosphaera sp.]
MRTNDANIQLRELISNAFPTSLSLSHSDCEELRTKLVSLREGDVLTILGPVLLDLLETHTESVAIPDWADSIVRYLCAGKPPPVELIPDSSINTKQFSDFSASYQPEAEALFNKFTIQQSRAIYSWLEAAQSWSKSNIPSAELTAALVYWNRKSNQ